MRRFIFIGFVLVAVLTACTKEHFEYQEDGPQEGQSETRLFEEKVKAFALSSFTDISKGRGATLFGLPNVESVEPITSEIIQRTGTERDTVAYIVNFDQNASIVIAGSRALPLTTVAISDSRMAMIDTVWNKGLATFMKLLPNYYYQELGRRIIAFGLASAEEVVNFTRNDMQQLQDQLSVYEDFPTPPTIFNLNDYLTWVPQTDQTITLEREILLSAKWGQRAPFNLLAPLINGELPPAGCVSIAIAQITTYYEHPKVLEGQTLDWDILSNDSEDDFKTDEEKYAVAYYVRTIGNYCNNYWGLTGTGANPYIVPSVFTRLGYYRSDLIPYDRILVEEYLSAKRPFFIGGYGYPGGHAWVIDGTMKTSYKIHCYNKKGDLIATWTVYPTYYHCNWGAEGRNNGFYKKDVFDLINGIVYDDNGDIANVPPETPAYYFTEDIRIIKDIKPIILQTNEN